MAKISLSGAGTLSHGCSCSEVGGAECRQCPAARHGMMPSPSPQTTSGVGLFPFCLRAGSSLAKGLQDLWHKLPQKASTGQQRACACCLGRAAGLGTCMTPRRGWAVSLEVNNAPLVSWDWQNIFLPSHSSPSPFSPK